MKAKVFLRWFFALLTVQMVLFGTYAYEYNKLYPLAYTGRSSLDAKIEFIRLYVDRKKVDTIVVGSSLGLNNVLGSILEKSSKRCNSVLNLSVYGAAPSEVRQILELTSVFPNLKRVLYSTQYPDFGHKKVSIQNYDAKKIAKFLAKEMNPIQETQFRLKASSDLEFLHERKKEWQSKRVHSNSFHYLGFEHTGSVPLRIYGDDIIQHRYRSPHPPHGSEDSFGALYHMSQEMHNKGIQFYLVQQPYRPELAKRPKMKWGIEYLDKRCREIVVPNKGKCLQIYNVIDFKDNHFADRSHLNEKGAIRSSEALGKIIDSEEGN